MELCYICAYPAETTTKEGLNICSAADCLIQHQARRNLEKIARRNAGLTGARE